MADDKTIIEVIVQEGQAPASPQPVASQTHSPVQQVSSPRESSVSQDEAEPTPGPDPFRSSRSSSTADPSEYRAQARTASAPTAGVSDAEHERLRQEYIEFLKQERSRSSTPTSGARGDLSDSDTNRQAVADLAAGKITPEEFDIQTGRRAPEVVENPAQPAAGDFERRLREMYAQYQSGEHSRGYAARRINEAYQEHFPGESVQSRRSPLDRMEDLENQFGLEKPRKRRKRRGLSLRRELSEEAGYRAQRAVFPGWTPRAITRRFERGVSRMVHSALGGGSGSSGSGGSGGSGSGSGLPGAPGAPGAPGGGGGGGSGVPGAPGAPGPGPGSGSPPVPPVPSTLPGTGGLGTPALVGIGVAGGALLGMYAAYKAADKLAGALAHLMDNGILPVTAGFAKLVPVLGQITNIYEAYFRRLDRQFNQYLRSSPGLQATEINTQVMRQIYDFQRLEQRGGRNDRNLREILQEGKQQNFAMERAADDLEAAFTKALYRVLGGSRSDTIVGIVRSLADDLSIAVDNTSKMVDFFIRLLEAAAAVQIPWTNIDDSLREIFKEFQRRGAAAKNTPIVGLEADLSRIFYDVGGPMSQRDAPQLGPIGAGIAGAAGAVANAAPNIGAAAGNIIGGAPGMTIGIGIGSVVKGWWSKPPAKP